MKKRHRVFKGVRDPNYKVNSFPSLKVDKPGLAPVSNTITSVTVTRDPLEHKWKKGKEETPETVEEIERKAKRIGIAYNKGAYQYIDSAETAKHLGKK